MADESTARAHLALLRGLRAVRQFRPGPVPEPVLEGILDVARWSGSANNRQHWELVVVRDPATLRTLAAVGGSARHLAEAALGIVLVMAGDDFETETYDEGRLSERIMLAAHGFGVGACIGWFDGDEQPQAKRILRIPEHRLVRTAISLGYPDEQARRARPPALSPRKPLSATVHWERYG